MRWETPEVVVLSVPLRKKAEGPGNTSRPSPPLQPWHEVSV